MSISSFDYKHLNDISKHGIYLCKTHFSFDVTRDFKLYYTILFPRMLLCIQLLRLTLTLVKSKICPWIANLVIKQLYCFPLRNRENEMKLSCLKCLGTWDRYLYIPMRCFHVYLRIDGQFVDSSVSVSGRGRWTQTPNDSDELIAMWFPWFDFKFKSSDMTFEWFFYRMMQIELSNLH